MTKVLLHAAGQIADLAVTVLIVAYLIFSSVNLCIKIPLSPLVSVAIIAAACLLAFCLVNIKRWLNLANKNFSQASLPHRSAGLSEDNIYGDKLSLNHGNFMGRSKRTTGGSSIDHGFVPNSVSRESSFKRSAFSVDHLGSISQQPFTPATHHDMRFFSFYSDYGRRSPYSKAPEDTSLVDKFVNRVAFYSYFDPDFQKHDRNRCLKLLSGFNFWFKHMWIKPLFHHAIWVVSGIIFTITWCIVWEWAACYMTRDEGDINLLHWSVESVPNVYWILEGAYQLIFCIDYIIRLYDSDVRYKYIFSLHGFIDLTMTSALSQTIAWVSYYLNFEDDKYASVNKFGLLFFGPLRFLKLTQAEELLNKSFDNLSDIHTVIIGIATAALSLLFAFSGMMYLLEAPNNNANFINPFDFIYFGVATMGTVGYGDFTPKTPMGRFLSIGLICMCISLGAVHFKRLKEAISKKDINMGSPFDLNGYKYVLFWGPLSAYQMLTFCRCIANTFDGILDTVVVATPLPLELYQVVYRAVKRNTRINLYIVGGSEKICAPSSVYKLIGFSMLTVVVNDMETETYADHVNDDRMTILRSMACLNITRHLGVPIGVQLHGSEYAAFLDPSNITSICYIQELKYKLIAKSVACRGLFYLIVTLFHTPTNIRRTRAYVEDLYNLFATSSSKNEEDLEAKSKSTLQDVTMQLFEIVTGMKFQLYKLTFPPCFHGLGFVEMCQHLYKTKGMILLGVASTDQCILNPVDFIIGSEQGYAQYQGLVLAKSLRDVLQVSLMNNPSLDFLPYKVAEVTLAKPLERFTPIPECSERAVSSHEVQDNSLIKGIFQVGSCAEAMKMFTETRPQLILLCGWSNDMHGILKELLVNNNSNVICLAPIDLVEAECGGTLSAFRNAVVYIDGSAMKSNDLIRSGVSTATCIVVLNSKQSWCPQKNKHMPKDFQVLFVRHLIKRILGSPSHTSKPPHIIMDIQHSSCLEYLDPSLVSSMEASCGRDAMKRVWQNFGEFMTSYEMASGTIFVQDMLYGLLAHSYVPCSNSVGYDTIERILDGDPNSKISNRISLEEIPGDFVGATFKNLFKRQLFVSQKICIGILRTYKDPMIDTELKQLVLVAPQPSFVLHAEDQVYVVKPNLINWP